MAVQPATLARGPGRPASLYLARSKSISSSNPDLAVAPGSVDDEVSRILASKVGRGGPGVSSHGCRVGGRRISLLTEDRKCRTAAWTEADSGQQGWSVAVTAWEQ